MLEREQQITILDRLYGVITAPGVTLRGVARDRLYVWGFAILLASSLVNQLLTPVPAEPLPPGFEQISLPVSLLIGMAIFVVYSLMIHVVAKLFGGVGAWLGYVAAAGFAGFPAFLRLPLLLLQTTSLKPIASALLTMVALWLIVLNVTAVKQSYDLTVGKSIGTIIVGAIVTGIVLGALFFSYMMANPDLTAQWLAMLESM